MWSWSGGHKFESWHFYLFILPKLLKNIITVNASQILKEHYTKYLVPTDAMERKPFRHFCKRSSTNFDLRFIRCTKQLDSNHDCLKIVNFSNLKNLKKDFVKRNRLIRWNHESSSSKIDPFLCIIVTVWLHSFNSMMRIRLRWWCYQSLIG